MEIFEAALGWKKQHSKLWASHAGLLNPSTENERSDLTVNLSRQVYPPTGHLHVTNYRVADRKPSLEERHIGPINDFCIQENGALDNCWMFGSESEK